MQAHLCLLNETQKCKYIKKITIYTQKSCMCNLSTSIF